jgi:glycosyltransferase involved in cell wall biosynthesis
MSHVKARSVLLVEEGGIGGVANYTDELAAAIADAGWEVHLATGCDHDPGAPPGVTIHRVFPYIRDRSPLERVIRRMRLSRAINGMTHLAASARIAQMARNCEVVHVQGEEWPPLGAAQAMMLRTARRPVIYTPHNTFSRDARSYSRSNALIRRCATRIVVHSNHDLRALDASQAHKTVVIPHGEYGGLAGRGAPTADRDAARAELNAADDDLVVLLFGQLRPDKGVRDLLLASAQTDGVRVVLAGEDKGALDEVGDLLADERLRERVVVRSGFASPEQTGRLFAASDVVALPYHRASASGVLLLAYGYGRPVVAYPVGGLPEYVLDGQSGWLCRRAEPAALAEKLREIVRAGREECRTRGERARELSDERFGWQSIAASTIELYDRVLTQSRRALDGQMPADREPEPPH